MHRVRIPDGKTLAVDWYPAERGAPVALFVHGLGSNRRGEKAVHFAERFNEKAWSFAAFDMPGHGDSDGTVRDLTMSAMLSDMTAVAGWIAQTPSSSRIVLIGSSMGAAVIAWYALTQPNGACPLVMIAPALGFPTDLATKLGPESVDRWRRTGLHRFNNAWIDLEIGYGLLEDGAGYDPDLLLRRHLARTLILHGMQDDTVDWNDSVAFARQSRARVDLIIVGDGDHRLTHHKQLMFDWLWFWLERQSRTDTATVDV